MQLSIPQVARLLHTSPRTVMRRRAAGELPEGELTEEALKQLPLLHAGQAARIVRRSAATIRRWRADGRLRGVRTGEVWRYSLADLEAASQPLVSTPGEEERRSGVVTGEPGAAPVGVEVPVALRGQAPDERAQASGAAYAREETAPPAHASNTLDFLGGRVRLEPENTARVRSGGWLIIEPSTRVFVPRRAFLVLCAWLPRAVQRPRDTCALTVEDVARAVPTSKAFDDVTRGKRIGFADVHGVMGAVSSALARAGLPRPRAIGRTSAYEFPAIGGACGAARAVKTS